MELGKVGMFTVGLFLAYIGFKLMFKGFDTRKEKPLSALGIITFSIAAMLSGVVLMYVAATRS